MKDKHIRIASDQELWRQLNRLVRLEMKRAKPWQRLKLLLKFGFYLFWTIFFYIQIWNATSPSWLALSYILYGLSSLLLAFNFAHDLSHDATFKHKWINNLCYTILYTIVGAHAESWKERHVHAHHFAPNVQDYDTDLQITSLIRVEPNASLYWFHRYQHWYAPIAYTSYSLYWVFIKDYYVYFQDGSSKLLPLGYHVSFWSQKIFYLVYLLLLPMAFSPVGPYWVLLSFLLMHLIQSVFLLFTFFITHHVEETEYFNTDEEGFIQTSWLNNQLRSSNDFHPFSEFANFIFGGFNNHIAHHLFPHINHVHYPRLNRALYRFLSQSGFEPNHTSFFGGICSHLRYLKKMGRVQLKEQKELQAINN